MGSSILEFLGHGIYSPAEAARYARVSPQLTHRWLFGPDAVLQKHIDSGDERIISFVDFVQMLTVRRLRQDESSQISMPRVRHAIRVLRDKHGIEFPFARPHELCAFEGDIVYITADNTPIFVSGKETNQYLHRRIVEPHLKRLTFDPTSGLAHQFEVWREQAANGDVVINMDAKRRFGAPMLPSGYTAQTLYDAVQIEGGFSQAAGEFGVPLHEVQAAYNYWDSLLVA